MDGKLGKLLFKGEVCKGEFEFSFDIESKASVLRFFPISFVFGLSL